jgi:hypothetical protein
MLAFDLVGFHTEQWAENFRDSARARSGGRALPEVAVLPIGVEPQVFASGGAPDDPEIVDFAPRTLGAGGQLDAPHDLVRLIRPLAGVPRLVIDFRPRPDYGRVGGEHLVTPQGVEVRGVGMPLHLYTNVAGDRICTPAEVSVREPLYFVLSCGNRQGAPTVAAITHMLEETVRAWQLWAMTCALPSFAPTHVLRSALCLKLHTYVDTGAIIAAATTSIPEVLDTERTCDDRHCWLRSAASTAEALRRLSYLHEGTQFISFLRDVAESAPLQPVYGIGGERQLSELTLHHLRGFAGSPVRIGSAAATQQRNDLHGEVVLCLQAMLDDPRIELDRPDDLFGLLERLVEDRRMLQTCWLCPVPAAGPRVPWSTPETVGAVLPQQANAGHRRDRARARHRPAHRRGECFSACIVQSRKSTRCVVIRQRRPWARSSTGRSSARPLWALERTRAPEQRLQPATLDAPAT